VIHKKADRILDDFFGNAEKSLNSLAQNGNGAS
jgi:hypothetical protein